ncbi:MAG: MFS transporter, partial [Candidatus Sedimenticola sp. (ex Thyasira tokunagai)]
GVNSAVFMLLYGATCVSLIWMHYTFAREHETKSQQVAKEHALNTYVNAHENPETYAAARAAVEQADLLEELIDKYSVAREAAEKEAEKIRNGQLQGKTADVLE